MPWAEEATEKYLCFVIPYPVLYHLLFIDKTESPRSHPRRTGRGRLLITVCLSSLYHQRGNQSHSSQKAFHTFLHEVRIGAVSEAVPILTIPDEKQTSSPKTGPPAPSASRRRTRGLPGSHRPSLFVTPHRAAPAAEPFRSVLRRRVRRRHRIPLDDFSFYRQNKMHHPR